MLPSCIDMRISRSSALISYTDISPEEKPIPTTSMAGDCTRAVTAVEGAPGIGVEVTSEARGNVCMHVLGSPMSRLTVSYKCVTY